MANPTTKKQDPEYYRRYYAANRDRLNAYRRGWYQTDPKRRQKHRRWNLQSKYGITEADYQSMFDKQGGKCGICDKHQSELKQILAVDHDHKTGVVRGLLCSYCNRFLAVVENQKFVERASEYLLKTVLGLR